ncbi:MAG: hypothetical protein R3E79_07310 [Caldilineaceae bacterium]
MQTERKIAITAGVLFILATASQSHWQRYYRSNPRCTGLFIQRCCKWQPSRGWGAFDGSLAAAGSAGDCDCALPRFEKQNETLALGAVGFRLI